MFKIISALGFITGFFIFSAPLFAAVSVLDDEHHKVTLARPAQRIISLAPHITETLFAAGAGNKIIGVSAYSDYPEAAKKITKVGGYPSLDLEKIISLKPDLVIAWSSGRREQIEKLKMSGLTVFYSEPRYPRDIAHTIERFGVLAGTTETANKSSAAFLHHYNSLKKRYAEKTKVKVFYEVWDKPMMTVSRKHLISSIIELCGGENVFGDLSALTPQISLEAVLAARPDVIVSGGAGKTSPEWLKEWKAWPEIPAVKNDQLYFIDPSLMQRVGPRILQAADKLCEDLDLARKH